MISKYQHSSVNAIYEFSDVIEETKDFKRYQLENLIKLEEENPDPGKNKNLGDLQYYQDMEPYELLCRKVLKNRIKKVLMVKLFISFEFP
jgi:hypothetical protein